MADAVKKYDPATFEWWEDALEGVKPPIHDIPMQGYFALKRSAKAVPEPVAIWYKDGKVLSLVGGERIKVEWLSVARNPIPFDVYEDVLAGKPWPHEIIIERADGSTDSTVGANATNDDEQLLGNIEEWTERGRKALKQGRVDTKEEADALTDIASKLTELCSEADKRRLERTKPHREAEAEINAKFNGKIKPASPVAKDLKTKAGVWLSAEKKRREDEAKALAEKLAAEQPAGEDGAAPTVTVTAAPVKVGTRGKSLAGYNVTFVEYDKNDPDARAKAAAYLLTKNVPDFLEALDKAALRLLRAGDTIPGAKVGTRTDYR